MRRGHRLRVAHLFQWRGVSPAYWAELPASPGKVTFEGPPVTLQKGRSYVFKLTGRQVSGCFSVQFRDFGRNAPRVSAANGACERVYETSADYGDFRMWHVNGQNDWEDCGGQGTPSEFEPSMPTGWLAVDKWNSYRLMIVTNDAGSNEPHCFWNQTPTYWRQHPDGYNQYVCRWDQFNTPGVQAAHDWYDSGTWAEARDYAPRDSYIKLHTIDYDALLQKHRPLLRYHSEEGFHALNPAAATDFYETGDDPDQSNRLLDSSGPFASANAAIVAGDSSQGLLRLDFLGAEYPQIGGRRAASEATPQDFISLRGNLGFPADSGGYADDAATMEARPGYGDRVYARAVHGSDGALWLQYWIYYYFDDQTNFGGGAHESDWELVQVRLDANHQPDLAAYAQHAVGEVCNWATQVESYSDQPIVYVAQGSHASYFRAGHYDDPDPDDNADGEGDLGSPTADEIRDGSPSWVGWPGRWGDSGNTSPFGPGHGGNLAKWADPSDWASGLSNCDVG